MRRLTILIIAMIAMLGMRAEQHYQPHISVGARGGISMDRMSFSPSVKQSWGMGYAGALTFRYTEEKLFGLIAEVGITQRGWKENFEEHPFNYSRTLTYVTVPFMTHIYFGAPRFKAFINLGPSISYMIGSSINADFDYKNIGSIANFPTKRHTEQLYTEVSNMFDYGISAGIGFEFYATPRNSVVIEARYYYGLGNIFPSSKADVFGASRCMNIEATVGYNFRVQ